jgi:hypothetical protein
MQLSFDIDGSLPEVVAACVAGDESGQNRDLAPRAVVAESNETASNQADIPLTGAFDAKGAFGATPSPHPRGNPRAATSHSRPPAGVTGRLKGMSRRGDESCPEAPMAIRASPAGSCVRRKKMHQSPKAASDAKNDVLSDS